MLFRCTFKRKQRDPVALAVLLDTRVTDTQTTDRRQTKIMKIAEFGKAKCNVQLQIDKE